MDRKQPNEGLGNGSVSFEHHFMVAEYEDFLWTKEEVDVRLHHRSRQTASSLSQERANAEKRNGYDTPWQDLRAC